MKLSFTTATTADVLELVALHAAVAARLTQRFGPGPWSTAPSEKGVLFGMRHAQVILARNGKTLAGTLRLAAKKPWAIDVAYFTPVKKPLYLTGMAVAPKLQRKGVGRELLQQAILHAHSWPANAIRLDAFDAAAGAGPFYAKCNFRETGRVTYRNAALIYYEVLL